VLGREQGGPSERQHTRFRIAIMFLAIEGKGYKAISIIV